MRGAKRIHAREHKQCGDPANDNPGPPHANPSPRDRFRFFEESLFLPPPFRKRSGSVRIRPLERLPVANLRNLYLEHLNSSRFIHTPASCFIQAASASVVFPHP